MWVVVGEIVSDMAPRMKPEKITLIPGTGDVAASSQSASGNKLALQRKPTLNSLTPGRCGNDLKCVTNSC